MILNLQIEVKDNVEAYRATTRLAVDFDVVQASLKGKNWVFKERSKVKYFLKENYLDQETKKQVNITEINQ